MEASSPVLLMTILDAARVLAISRSTVWKLMDSGALPWVKIGGARRVSAAAVKKAAERGLDG